MLTKQDFNKFEILLDKKLKTIKEDIIQIRKDQKLVVRFFDREYLDLRKRVERIENHLNLGAN